MSNSDDEIAALREQIATLEARNNEQQEHIQQQNERLGLLYEKRANDRQRITALEADLAQYRSANERDKASIRQQVHETQDGDKGDTIEERAADPGADRGLEGDDE